MGMDLRLSELEGLPPAVLNPSSIEGGDRSIKYSLDVSEPRDEYDDEGRYILMWWRSPNDLEVSVGVHFDRPSSMVVEVDDYPVETDIATTADIEHQKLRAEVEWAFGVVKRAAAEARANPESVDDAEAARMREWLDGL